MRGWVRERPACAYAWMQANTISLTLAVALGAAALAITATLENVDQDTRIRAVERSPCVEHPAGRECAAIRAKVAEAEPLRGPCTSYQRVTGERGRNCPQRFVGGTPSEVQITPKFGVEADSPPPANPHIPRSIIPAG